MGEANKMDALIADDLLLQAKSLSHEFDYKLFNNINLSLYKKESIAIIGMSGSGKSTLLKLLLRFYDPTKGQILINDNDIINIRRFLPVNLLYQFLYFCFSL